MRTPGKLHLRGRYNRLFDADANPIASIGDRGPKANAVHIRDCWNMIESIGGDPESVGDLREALNSLCLVTDCIRATGEIPIENEWGELNAARALLEKTKVTP